jgi:alkaline phosphatase D
VNTTITRESLVADFRTVRKVQTKDAEVFTRAQFTIEDRKPGLNLTADNPPAAAAARTLAAATADDTVAWETARP